MGRWYCRVRISLRIHHGIRAPNIWLTYVEGLGDTSRYPHQVLLNLRDVLSIQEPQQIPKTSIAHEVQVLSRCRAACRQPVAGHSGTVTHSTTGFSYRPANR